MALASVLSTVPYYDVRFKYAEIELRILESNIPTGDVLANGYRILAKTLAGSAGHKEYPTRPANQLR